MLFEILEAISRKYYSIKNNITKYLFSETEIIPFRSTKINSIKYLYYILNYYCNTYPEYFFNFFNCRSHYNLITYYEVSYRDNGMNRCSIINGTLYDVFNYTRYLKTSDELKMFFKCNLIINDSNENIRQLIRKYDTKTNLYNIIYFNYSNLINDTKNKIEFEIGSNKYDLREMDKNLILEDA
jgi:hypothetical protein